MNSFKITGYQLISNTQLVLTFSTNVSSNINSSNFSIYAKQETINQPKITEVYVNDNTVTLTIITLYPLVSYTLSAFSTVSNKFLSADNSSIIQAPSNIIVIGEIEYENNIIKQNMVEYLSNNLYSYDEGLISKYIEDNSFMLAQALFSINQIGNEVYLSKTIIDEQKTRGSGNTDRLSQESAYEIIRVSTNPITSKYNFILNIQNFQTQWVSLQQNSKSDTAYNIDASLIFTLSKNIISANSINILYNSNQNITYNIEKYGYYIYNYQYDLNASLYYIDQNQIKLNINFFYDNNIDVDSIVSIYVNYNYKNLNIEPVQSTINVYDIRLSSRENVPPILNIFTLEHNNIVDQSGNTITYGGVVFNDPINPTIQHPAFLYEVPFNSNALPNKIGYYSVDYTSGTVYVFGANVNDGTGNYPPIATYYYKYTYIENVDYNINYDENYIVSIPFGNLRSNNCYISHSYDNILVNGIDYISNPHSESLNESIGNSLLALNIIRTQNFPITNVFKIYNLTSGETYNVIYWNYNRIIFSYIKAPNIQDIFNEKANFKTINNELLIGEYISTNIVKFNLKNNLISSATQDSIGAFYNTSVIFSNTYLFSNELYFDRNNVHYTTNQYNVLTNVGDYTIDYSNGIVYLYTNPSTSNFGNVSYNTCTIQTNNVHLVKINNIYFAADININVNYNYFEDSSIILNNFDYYSDEIAETTNGTYYTTQNYIGTLYKVYILNDLLTNRNPINFADQCYTIQNQLYFSFRSKTLTELVKFSTYYYIDFTIGSQITANILLAVISVNKLSGAAVSYSYTLGNSYIEITSSVVIDEPLVITYSLTFNTIDPIVVNYTPGNLIVEYTYLADEIQVSYEYGDNEIDFSINPIATNSTYYASYRVGALRDTLYKNFGSLTGIPELQAFDLSFNRERYRDCLAAALYVVGNGATNNSIKNVPTQITKIAPQIDESMYDVWSLGYTSLTPQSITTTGDFNYTKAVFGNGVLINNQTVSLPATSNMSLEQGTLEAWIIPQWNGLDNQDIIDFIITGADIYIGANAQYQPDSNFSLDDNIIIGTPSIINTGIYIYIDKIPSTSDVIFSETSYRWYIVNNTTNNVSITINTNNKFYTPTFVNYNNLLENNLFTPILNTFSSTKKTININKSSSFAFSFVSDDRKYLYDSGDQTANRISIYKDSDGYLYFTVLDSNSKKYSLSTNIGSWKINEPHLVAATWNLNTINARDSLHLFIDGFEVQNKITYYSYGNNSNKVLLPENITSYAISFMDQNISNQVAGFSTKNTTSGTNMTSLMGSPYVSSVGISNVNPGDSLTINESWANNYNPYTINEVIGETLVLNQSIPFTLSNISFTVNSQTFDIPQAIFAYGGYTVNTSNYISSAIGSNTSTSYKNYIQVSAPIDANIIVYNITNGRSYCTTITSNTGSGIYCSDNILVTSASINIKFYSSMVELSDYSATESLLTINNGLSVNDLITVQTYGLSSVQVSEKNNLISSTSTNIIRANSYPIDINYISIRGLLYPQNTVNIGSAGLVLSGHNFTYTFTVPYVSPYIQISLLGSNIDFTNNQTISNGTSVSITSYGSIIAQITSTSTTFTFTGTVINTTSPLFTLELKDAFGITDSSANQQAFIDYYYQIDSGNFIAGSFDHFLSNNIVNGKIEISGIVYTINSLNQTTNTITTTPTLPTLTNQAYVIYQFSNISGYQNGLFLLQEENNITPYNLIPAIYQITYLSGMSIPIDLTSTYMFIGSDINSENQINAIIDCFKISSVQYFDERFSNSSYTITKDFNSTKKFQTDNYTLVNIDFGNLPLTNNASYYVKQLQNINLTLDNYNFKINDNFNLSFYLDNPLVLDNNGIVVTTGGNIEFWVSPTTDYWNDPSEKYLLDMSNGNERISIYRSIDGYLNLIIQNVQTVYSSNDVLVTKISAPITWNRYTWHKVKFMYNFSSNQIFLFIDGYLYGNITQSLNGNILTNTNIISDQTSLDIIPINITNPFNFIYIGSDYNEQNVSYVLIDNIKISNKIEPLYAPYGEILDPQYSSNINNVYPLSSDAYTTYILSSNNIQYVKNNDFAIVKSEYNGNYDFTITIADTNNIIKNDSVTKNVMEKMIKYLKPVSSRVFIKYEN